MKCIKFEFEEDKIKDFIKHPIIIQNKYNYEEISENNYCL